MKEFILIAWRNLWRNKRRTLITISSIFFAVFFAILMRSFQLGTYNHMINNMVTQFSGHLQIQDKEYYDNQTINYSLPYTDSLKNQLKNNDQINNFFPRIQTGTLASSGENSKVAVIMGVNYQKENDLVNIPDKIIRYYLDSTTVKKIAKNMDKKNSKIFLKYKNKVYCKKEDLREDLYADGLDTSKYIKKIYKKTKLPKVKKNFNNVLVGYKLAQYLELGIGDSIIMIGQGFRGASAVGKFEINGLLKFPMDGFNNRFVYMPLHKTQKFLSAYELNSNSDTTFFVNYIAINTIHQASIRNKDYERIMDVKVNIEDKLNNNMLTVVGWHNLNKDMLQGLQMDNVSGKIMIFVLYLIIAFGVLGTVMMMIAERKREFGVMMAVGMKRRLLSLIVTLEMFFMGIIAAIAGIIVTAPIIWYGHKNPIRFRGEMAEGLENFNMEPILPFQSFDIYILSQVGIVSIIVVAVLMYALLKIKSLKVISALRA